MRSPFLIFWIFRKKFLKSKGRNLFSVVCLFFVKASPCLVFAAQKSVKIEALFQGFPLGGSCQRSWLMRGATCFLFLAFLAELPPKGNLGGLVSPNGDKWGAHQLRTVVCNFPIYKIWSLISSLPLGGKVYKAKLWTDEGAAYYAKPIFDFLNIPEGISEDQGA